MHLNLVATSASGIIFFWQYEHMRVSGTCSNGPSEVIFMNFIDPYPMLVSLDRSNEVCVWHIEQDSSFGFYTPIVKIVLDTLENN